MLRADQCVITLVDVQGKLARLMHHSDDLLVQLQRLLRGARLFDIPVIWVEQVPDKLGPTAEELQPLLEGLTPISKHSFGCYGEPAYREALEKTRREHVVVCGIESHVCVYQTVANLLRARYAVHTVEDAISSRTKENRRLGLDRMRALGATPTSVEMLLFEFQQEAQGPLFREMARLFR